MEGKDSRGTGGRGRREGMRRGKDGKITPPQSFLKVNAYASVNT